MPLKFWDEAFLTQNTAGEFPTVKKNYRKTKQQSTEQLTGRRKTEVVQQVGCLHNPTTRRRKRKQKQQVTRHQAKAELLLDGHILD
jgi:hypothetical protein